MDSVEFSCKFRLPCFSTFIAWNGLEALLYLVVELISSATTHCDVCVIFGVDGNPYFVERLSSIGTIV